MTRPRAAIDLGTNSAQLLVRDGSGAVLVDRCRLTGLGRGLRDGHALHPDAADRALDALLHLAGDAQRAGVDPTEVVAQATSALRRAADANAFRARVREACGLSLTVISGEEEARRNRDGALSDRTILPLHTRRVVVIDVGGGSTELAVDVDGTGGPVLSLPLGTVTLIDQHLPDDAPWTPAADARLREALHLGLRDAPPLEADALVAIAGTATALVGWQLGLRRWDPDRAHGAVLHAATLSDLATRWQRTRTADRAADLPADPDRASTLPAGIRLMQALLAHLGHDRAIVSVRDARWWLTDPRRRLGSDGSRE